MNNLGLNNHLLVADLFSNIAIAYKNQHANEKALDYYQKSMPLYLSAVGANHPKIANLYINMGILYSAMKNQTQAISYFEKALSLGRQIFEKDNPHFAITYLNMGIECLQAENYRRALYFFNEAIQRGSKTLGAKNPIIAEAYQGIGQIYAVQKNFSLALAYFQRAINSLALEFDSLDIYSNPPLEKIADEARLMNALFAKARAFEDLFEWHSKNLNDLIASVNTFKLTINLIDKICSSYLAENSKLFFSDTTHTIFCQADRLPPSFIN